MAYRGVRALVLGASGFIGRWIARYLARAGADAVLAVRDLRPAAELFAEYGVSGRIIGIDLSRPDDLRHAISDLRPAIVFNLAGYGIDRSERDESIAYLINSSAVEMLCEFLGRYTVPEWPGRRLVHAGSALEYGTASGDLNEETEPTPTTLYGRSKLAGTMALADFCVKNDMQAMTARLFTVYGPGEHPGRLLPALIEAAATRHPLDLTDGRQLRDFTYVEDVAEGMLRLGLTHGAPGEIINLATGRLTAVRDFISTAAAVIGLPAELLRTGALPTRPEEMNHDPVAIDRLRGLTTWSPKTNIEDGIRRTMGFLPNQKTRQNPELNRC